MDRGRRRLQPVPDQALRRGPARGRSVERRRVDDASGPFHCFRCGGRRLIDEAERGAQVARGGLLHLREPLVRRITRLAFLPEHRQAGGALHAIASPWPRDAAFKRWVAAPSAVSEDAGRRLGAPGVAGQLTLRASGIRADRIPPVRSLARRDRPTANSVCVNHTAASGESAVDDTLLTLDQARAALIGDVAERSNAWPSIKTLRRAYSAGHLAVVQPVAGGRVMVWRSELMRWASARRMQPTPSPDATAPRPGPRRSARRRPAAPKPKRGAIDPAGREREGAPPRLSLDDLKAA